MWIVITHTKTKQQEIKTKKRRVDIGYKFDLQFLRIHGSWEIVVSLALKADQIRSTAKSSF